MTAVEITAMVGRGEMGEANHLHILRSWETPTSVWAATEIERLQAEVAALREERDALLREPISLADMDSEDEKITDLMIAYYWCKQAQDARAALKGTPDDR